MGCPYRPGRGEAATREAALPVICEISLPYHGNQIPAEPLHRWGSALYELNHEDDNRDDQQEMDEAPQGIGGDQAQEPQH